MSPDDVPALLGLLVGAALLTVPRLRRVYSLTPFACGENPRLTTTIAFVGCLLALWAGLVFFAAQEVRESFGYQVMFVAAGAIAIEMASRSLAVLGLDPDLDGLERNNVAARIASIGLWVAVTICAIGANLGHGDEIETTLIPLALCTLGLIAIAFGVSAATGGFAPVAIEREATAGGRLGALFIAASLPLASAAAGDWVSTAATLHDFAVATPWLIGLLVIAASVETRLAHRQRMASVKNSAWVHTVLPATAYLSFATASWYFTR